MLEGISERVRQLSEGAFTTGSRPGTAERGRESGISTGFTFENDLLIAVIVLVIIVFALIVVIIYGYCKYVRGGRTKKMENSTDGRATADVEQPPPSPLDPQQPASTIPDTTHLPIPVKTRKRSMTFSETDEECRKYREDLADSYTGTGGSVSSTIGGDRSRKKSVVTFAGVEEIDAPDFHADPPY